MTNAESNVLTSRLKKIEDEFLAKIAVPVNCAELEIGNLQDKHSFEEIYNSLSAFLTLRHFVGWKIKELADSESKKGVVLKQFREDLDKQLEDAKKRSGTL